MKQTLILWALTSALLILAVVLLRAVFGRRMGAGLRYALWGLVLLRLLVPVQLFTVPVPELGWTQAVEAPRPSAVPAPGQTAGVPAVTGPLPDDVVVNVTTIPEPAAPHVVALDVQKLLGGLWLCGSAVTAAVFLGSNLSFARRLRRVRRPLCSFSREKKNQKELQARFQLGDRPKLVPGNVADCLRENEGPLPLYVAESLPSPCLFGLFRPAVYVTPAAAADPDVLRHVLAHEATHYRHGDHIWNVLRCAALALHWWNPLVWLAAALSRRDCELACDEGALKRLGEEERFAYGRTLLSLIGARSRPADLLTCATTMTGDGKTVAQRVKRIAQAPKRWLWAAVAAVLLAGIVTACAFGQAQPTHPPEQDPVSGDPRLPWTENADSLRYVRDKGGVPDEFAIRLHRDGTFTYYEGGYSSFIGAGTWTREGDVIRLADERNQANLMYHYFTLEEDALVFRAEESSDFMYTDVAGGDRFSLDTDPPERDWFDDAINRPPTEPTGTATPAPEEPVAYSIMEDANRMEITGLDCESASWFAGPASSGLVVAGRRDLMKAETLGHLSISQPRFLGEAFSAKGGELLSVYYPEEGPLLFFGFDEHDDGLLHPATASVYAFVDLASGTVQEKELSGFGSRAGEFTDELLVRTAQRLALIIEDAADYYDRAAAAQKELDAAQAELDAAQAELDAAQAEQEALRYVSKIHGVGRGKVVSGEQLDAILKALEEEGEKPADDIVGYDQDQSNEFDKPKDKQEEEWARRQTAEYQAVGVTMDGKNYYYQGQLVNIFLDIRSNGAFYTLDTNPAGTVNVKILRDGNDRITGAAYMTEEEAARLLSDMRDG